jgi:ElaB/YqjD/DUF883 family membrane-anchored ribosome-binding protein
MVLLVIGKDFAMATTKKSTAREVARPAARMLETFTDRIKSMFSEHPLATVGMAAGVGILLSFLWRRRHAA